MPPTPLSAQTVAAAAKLARLDIAPGETQDLQERLGAILAHAESLAALDLDDIEPLTQIGHACNRFGPDDPDPGTMLTPEQALALAPDHFEQFFRVPKVLGEGGNA
jgi:aspartyl-tRNA(Asn)/glutamyl-tRNA(Gln) amidotransferase subunit C